MTVQFQLQYMRQKALEKYNDELQQSENITTNSNNFIDRVQTRFNSTPNMQDAYSRVRNSNHVPTQGEIHYRRFTSGSYVDTTPQSIKE